MKTLCDGTLSMEFRVQFLELESYDRMALLIAHAYTIRTSYYLKYHKMSHVLDLIYQIFVYVHDEFRLKGFLNK